MKRYIYIIALALATSLSAAAQKTIEILHTKTRTAASCRSTPTSPTRSWLAEADSYAAWR